MESKHKMAGTIMFENNYRLSSDVDNTLNRSLERHLVMMTSIQGLFCLISISIGILATSLS